MCPPPTVPTSSLPQSEEATAFQFRAVARGNQVTPASVDV